MAEYLICIDDCRMESKFPEKSSGWTCGAKVPTCVALAACQPGTPGLPEIERMRQ